jgi:hypothetical protein
MSVPVDVEKGLYIQSVVSDCVSQACFYSLQFRKLSHASTCH